MKIEKALPVALSEWITYNLQLVDDEFDLSVFAVNLHFSRN